jgi:hypothetical protein
MPAGTIGLQSALDLIIERLKPTFVSPPATGIKGEEFINMELGTPTALAREAAIRNAACDWLRKHLSEASNGLRVIRDQGAAGCQEYDRDFLRRSDINSRFINERLFDPTPEGKKDRLDNRAIFIALLDAEFGQASAVVSEVHDGTEIKKSEDIAPGGASPAESVRPADAKKRGPRPEKNKRYCSGNGSRYPGRALYSAVA